jgi:hypothetical protein
MKYPSNVQKIMNRLIRSAIFLVTCFFIWHQLLRKNDWSDLLTTLHRFSRDALFLPGLLLIVALMGLNLAIEAGKWRFLIGKVEQISFFKSVKAILAGISVSSVMPNRTGEFLGRIYILDTTSRIEGILITLVGSMSQLLVTIVAGSAALLVFIPLSFAGEAISHGYLYHSIAVPVICLNLILLGLFFRLSFLARWRERVLRNRLEQAIKFLRVFGFYHNREIGWVILMSLARYMVFSTQFYVLLLLFGVRLPYAEALMLIALTYFIMALIPTVVITELGVRGAVSLYVFGLWMGRSVAVSADFNLGVLAASSALWIINLGIPAVAGTLFIFNLRFFRKTAG